MQHSLLEKYSSSLPDASRRELTARARDFLQWLGEDSLDADAVRRYMLYLERHHEQADNTRRKAWGVIRRLCIINSIDWPFRRGDAPIVREQNEEAYALPIEDVKAMVDVVLGRQESLGKLPDPRHRCCLCLSTVWGLRREEMAQMVPQYLDVEHRTLFVSTVKKGRQRYHSLPDYVTVEDHKIPGPGLFALPHLQDWGFRRPLSVSLVSELFEDLRGMIGLTGPVARGQGWHTVRRQAIKQAGRAGFNEPDCDNYYRWKRSTQSMFRRYAASREAGRAGILADVEPDDRRLDETFYAIHPFMNLWR